MKQHRQGVRSAIAIVAALLSLLYGSANAATLSHTAPVSVAQTTTLGGAITIAGGTLTFNVVGNLAGMQIDGAIGQSAPSAAIVKNGDGDLTLTAANTYSGLTSVNLGRLLPANA